MADELDSGSGDVSSSIPDSSVGGGESTYDEFEFESAEQAAAAANPQTPPEQPAPEPEPAASAPAFQPTEAHVQWGRHLGVSPEVVETMRQNGSLQRLADMMAENQRLANAAKAPPPQAQPKPQTPEQPAVTPPAGFEWSEDAKRELHPEFFKHSEFLSSRLGQMEKQFQEAIDKRLAELEPRFQKFEPLAQPLEQLLQHQRQVQKAADDRAYQDALTKLNAADILGSSEKGWNMPAVDQLGKTVQMFLANGAKSIEEAVQKAFRAEHGDRLQQQVVKQVSKATADRRQMVTGSPTQREGSSIPPVGDRAAYEHIRKHFEDQHGYQGKDDPDFLEALG